MYLGFRDYFERFPLISLSEIYKQYPHFDRRRLVEWKKKGYIEPIRQGFYRFRNQVLDENQLFLFANKIYHPSYISLESALSFYHIIPESVFTITSITTRNTAKFSGKCGSFQYRNLKSNLYFGYQIIAVRSFGVRIAYPEKAILDYLYLHPEIISTDDLAALRWNKETLNSLDRQKFLDYLQLFHSKKLEQRYSLLTRYML